MGDMIPFTLQHQLGLLLVRKNFIDDKVNNSIDRMITHRNEIEYELLLEQITYLEECINQHTSKNKTQERNLNNME